MAEASGREADKVTIGNGVGDGIPDAPRPEFLERVGDCSSPLTDYLQGHEPDGPRRLPRQQRQYGGIVVRGQRMIAEPGPVQQLRSDEQVALVDRAIQARKGRADNDHRVAGAPGERVRNGADVAGLARVERGGVLEVQAGRTAALQGIRGRGGGGHGLGSGRAADLQGDDESIRLDLPGGRKARR